MLLLLVVEVLDVNVIVLDLLVVEENVVVVLLVLV